MAIYILGPDSNGDCCTCAERVNVCDTCGTPTGCQCRLAREDVAVDCISQYVSSDVLSSIVASATPSTNTATLVFNCINSSPAASDSPVMWLSVSVSDGDLSFTSNGFLTWNDYTGITVEVYTESYSLVASASDYFDPSIQNFSLSGSIPLTAGCYLIKVTLPLVARQEPLGTDTVFTSTTVITADSMVVNPAMQLSTSLEQCPKMLIPPLTESTGDWYATEGQAQAIIDAQTDNCIAYIDSTPTSFSATDGGSTLTVSAEDSTGGFFAIFNIYASVNIESGKDIQISVSATESAPSPIFGPAFIHVYVYNYDGTQIFTDSYSFTSSGGTSFSFTTSYTGRYIVRCQASSSSSFEDGTKTINASFVISSDGSFSANPIQALYDVALDCAARLDC